MMLIEFEEIPTVNDLEEISFDDPPKLHRVIQKLKQVCLNENGIGVSAVQIGIPWKLFLVRGNGTSPYIPTNEFLYFANCKYTPVNDNKTLTIEGCLSIKNDLGGIRSFKLERFDNVTIEGLLINPVDLSTEEISWEMHCKEQGDVMQHEIDHHFGITIDQLGEEIFVW